DLGFACTMEQAKEKPNAGSPSYVAPEILLQGVKMSTISEAWSFGCIVFELLAGKPFIPESVATIKELKRRLGYLHQKAIDQWIDTSIPFEYRELLKGLLALDPAQRMTVEDFYAKCSELPVPK
ncbi:MAG TPA: hypothetical protein VHL30_03085, partial [Chlamydiales bacterium]|nr:hypothetical protein [Chlamydiales bacterium]